jgi:hypothetical protein
MSTGPSGDAMDVIETRRPYEHDAFPDSGGPTQRCPPSTVVVGAEVIWSMKCVSILRATAGVALAGFSGAFNAATSLMT